ncbi:MAG: hypothetical protein GXC72_00905 [Chitinophagaceae bacterium]|nr:hypothetical protein [Chitinophagaceae bacterium]
MIQQVIENTKKPAPRWFRKTKRAAEMLSDTAIVMLISMGYAENSLVMLWLRVGLSGILNTLEMVLANGEEYTKTTDNAN